MFTALAPASDADRHAIDGPDPVAGSHAAGRRHAGAEPRRSAGQPVRSGRQPHRRAGDLACPFTPGTDSCLRRRGVGHGGVDLPVHLAQCPWLAGHHRFYHRSGQRCDCADHPVQCRAAGHLTGRSAQWHMHRSPGLCAVDEGSHQRRLPSGAGGHRCWRDADRAQHYPAGDRRSRPGHDGAAVAVRLAQHPHLGPCAASGAGPGADHPRCGLPGPATEPAGNGRRHRQPTGREC